MNKKEARAILACSRKVIAAVESCMKQLGPELQSHAKGYWAGQLDQIAYGSIYGGMPIQQSMEVLDE